MQGSGKSSRCNSKPLSTIGNKLRSSFAFFSIPLARMWWFLWPLRQWPPRPPRSILAGPWRYLHQGELHPPFLTGKKKKKFCLFDLLLLIRPCPVVVCGVGFCFVAHHIRHHVVIAMTHAIVTYCLLFVGFLQKKRRICFVPGNKKCWAIKFSTRAKEFESFVECCLRESVTYRMIFILNSFD